MRIAILGAGRIGGNAAALFAAAGHEVVLAFSRDERRLLQLAARIGNGVIVGSPAQGAEFADVVMLSVPWRLVDNAVAQAGGLAGKVVIDTTNQFGVNGLEAIPDGLTAAQFNQRRIAGSRLVKAFNTLTSGFQASEAHRELADRRVVMFLCGDDAGAKQTVFGLIEDAGFAAADLGGLAEARPMEAPRRSGAVYGEEYRPADAAAAVAALRAGRPIPPTPQYGE
jgi:8-hydroxy-5-deazaflavin:NADPH oxidoreductase